MHLRARTGSRRTLAAAAVLAAALTVGVAACASTKNAEPEEKTFPFEGTTLNVTAHGDRVDLVAADRSDVRVVRWFDHTLATGVRSSWSLRGGTLDLRADCTGFANCDARFRVEVPRGVTVLPRLVLTDVRMPPTFRDEGLRAALELRRRQPGLAVVVLSQYVEHTYAGELLADGGRGVGYLLKDRVADVRALVAALNQVLDGGTVVDPEVVRRLFARRRDPLTRLTDRERQTLALMAQGRSNVAIAGELVVTETTVAKHIRSLFDKLGLQQTAGDHRRVLAVLTYLQQGEDDR